MPTGYLFKCRECGFMWDPEQSADVCCCERCGSSNRMQVIQEEGRFGCTSKMNTNALDINAKSLKDSSS